MSCEYFIVQANPENDAPFGKLDNNDQERCVGQSVRDMSKGVELVLGHALGALNDLVTAVALIVGLLIGNRGNVGQAMVLSLLLWLEGGRHCSLTMLPTRRESVGDGLAGPAKEANNPHSVYTLHFIPPRKM